MRCSACLALLVLASSHAASVARAQSVAPSSPAPEIAIAVPVPRRSLTLAEALVFARQHQPAIRAALARVAASTELAKVPSGQWKPTVGVTAQIFAMTANNSTATFVSPRVFDVPRVGATNVSPTPRFNPYASTFVGAGIVQEIFDFGRIAAARAAGDADVAVTRQRAAGDRLDIDFGVEEAFFAVFAAKAIVKASDDAYVRARAHRDLAEAGVVAGLRSPIELTRAEADLLRFEVGRIRARGGVAIAQSVFAAAIGSSEPAVDAVGAVPTPREMPTLANAIQQATAKSPRLLALLAEIKSAEARTRATAAEMRPDLSMTATISGRAGGAPPSSGELSDGHGFVPNVANWDAGLVFTWPLFEGPIAARRDAAKAEEQVRREEAMVGKEEELARVRQAYVSVEVARAAMVGLERTAVAAKANYDQADARFRAGLGTSVELADAESLRTDAEIQLALGRFEAARARAEFGRAIAEGL